MKYSNCWVAIAFGLLTLAPCGAGAPFKHPGVLNTQEQLDFIRARVHAGVEPWKSAFTKMRESRYASLSYTPKPRAVVSCGPYSKPGFGCREEKDDAAAAYTHALLWQITKKEAHARKAIEIMNEWSAVIQRHAGHNAPLQSSWTGSLFPRAAEIIRHTYNGWQPTEIERFKTMLRRAYLPHIVEGRPHYNGNWELSMIEAMIGIGVFLDDERLFDKGVSMWRKRVPAYFYLAKDGKSPIPPPHGGKSNKPALIDYWYDQTTFVNGLGQETCRDFGHLQMGLAAMINSAETAHHQGIDLYTEEAKRITTAMEFHAAFLLGKPIPDWLCGGKLKLGTIATWEIAYNHYHNRLGWDLPVTRKLIRTKARPTDVDLFMAWETLTHGELGRNGLLTGAKRPK